MATAFSNFLEVFGLWAMDMMQQHGMVVTLLAILGAFSIFSAIADKAFKMIKYLFVIFIATPLILVLGLMKKSERQQRIKELGEIRAFAKVHPDRWKRMVYYLLFCLFALMVMCIAYFALKRFVFPFYELNGATKIILSTYSTNSTNLTS